jgi:hypothetical protein
MKRVSRLPWILAFAVSATLLVAVVEGRISRRWGANSELRDAGEKVTQIPQNVPGWRLQSSEPMSDLALGMLKCQGYVNRAYVDDQTGAVVRVALFVGPTGPIAAHTPDICYSSREYDVAPKPQTVTIPAPHGGEHQFASLAMKRRNAQADPLHVYYAWRDDQRWVAPANSRWAFVGRPLLYKIQLAGPSMSGPTTNAPDPCRRFLDAFLPVVEAHVFASANR